MSTEQPCRRYSGGTWHAGKWLVTFRRKVRNLKTDHYNAPELVAWGADLAGCTFFGLNPAKWHPRVGRPNFPPCDRLDFPCARILSKLFLLGVLDLKTLAARSREYDAVVEQNAVPSATRRVPGKKVFRYSTLESRRHWLAPAPSALASLPDPLGRWRRYASCKASRPVRGAKC
jgi:hypothetical protein